MKYIMKSVFLDDMGTTGNIVCTDSPMESKEENALWEINSMRRHDGLQELSLDDFLELIRLKRIQFVAQNH